MAKLDPYPSTLTDKEWSYLREAFPPSRLGRPPHYSPRVILNAILNAILYVVRSGCTWRMMPHEFPHWRLVYYYFSRWQALGQDRDGAKLLEPFLHAASELEILFADGGYAGALVTWIKDLRRQTPLRLEIIQRPREATDFHLLPKRWVVERTFAWLANFRRFSKDYEVKTSHSEAFIYLANASLLARRLAKS